MYIGLFAAFLGSILGYMLAVHYWDIDFSWGMIFVVTIVVFGTHNLWHYFYRQEKDSWDKFLDGEE